MTDELTAVRRRFPIGTRVRGRINALPCGPGRAGVSVDLGDPVPGWVDVLQLPFDPARWPLVGREGFFEVLQHRLHEIRLFPLDAGMRGERCLHSRWSGAEWAAVTQRWPLGTRVDATVTYVFPGNREYTVRFADCHSTVEYEGSPPLVGSTVTLVVDRLLEWTHRIVLRPVQ